MTLRDGIHRLNALLEHDLSPMPLVTVFLGYWLPLEWMLRGWVMLGSTTPLEKCQALGASVLLNFLPAALAVALLIYLGGALSLFARVPYPRAVSWGMGHGANLLITQDSSFNPT